MHSSTASRNRRSNPFLFGSARRLAECSSMPELSPSPSTELLHPRTHQDPTKQQAEHPPTDRPPPPPPKDHSSKHGKRAGYILLEPFVKRAHDRSQAAAQRTRHIRIDDFIAQGARNAEAHARELQNRTERHHKRVSLKRCKSWCGKEVRHGLARQSCGPSTETYRAPTSSGAGSTFEGIKRRWTDIVESSSPEVKTRLPSRRSMFAALRASMRPTVPIHVPQPRSGQLPDPEVLPDQVFPKCRAAIEKSMKEYRAAVEKREKGEEGVGKEKGRRSGERKSEDTVATERERNVKEIKQKLEVLKLMEELDLARAGGASGGMDE